MTAHEVRIPRAWWCNEHQEVHEGELSDWNMEHQKQLHPVYAHMATTASEGPVVK